MAEGIQDFDALMNDNEAKGNQLNQRLKAIGDEIKELRDNNQSNDRIDFAKIMDLKGEISKEEAQAIINHINGLQNDPKFRDNTDLNDLKTYLTPLATPANNTIHKNFNQDRTGVQEINLKDRTLSDWLNNRDYGLNRRMNSIISRIGNNENLQNLKTNIMFIKDICDGKKASRSDFDRIQKYLISNIDQETTTTKIAGEDQLLDKEFSVNNNEDVRKVFLLLNQFLIETNNHLDDISNANNVRDKINEGINSRTAAVNRFKNWDFGGNPTLSLNESYPILNDTETGYIIDYITETASDDSYKEDRKSILNIYRGLLTYKSEAPYGQQINRIKIAIEKQYNEVKIINNFIEKFIGSGEELNDDNIDKYAKQEIIPTEDLRDLFTLYIDRDGSQNPAIVSYYRNNLAGDQANNIKEHYPEIQETIQSIDKLTQINKVNNFSKLSNEDISNITKYIESTKNLNATQNTPKGHILQYYNNHIKGHKGEGSKTDKDNFNKIKNAIEGTKEGQEGYREEIIKGERKELCEEMPTNELLDFDNKLVQSYITINHCIIQRDEYNHFKEEAQRQKETADTQANKDALKDCLNEYAIRTHVNEAYSKPIPDGIATIGRQKGTINYDGLFNSLFSENQDLYNTVKDNTNDISEIKETRTLKLNQEMFNKSKQFINQFNIASIPNGCLFLSNKMPKGNITTLIQQQLKPDDDINKNDTPTQQAQKLYKAQKIYYTLKSLQTPGERVDKGYKNIKALQEAIGEGITADGQFGDKTLLAAQTRINKDPAK